MSVLSAKIWAVDSSESLTSLGEARAGSRDLAVQRRVKTVKCESKGYTVWVTAGARVTDRAAQGGGHFLMISLTVAILLLGSSLTVAICSLNVA